MQTHKITLFAFLAATLWSASSYAVVVQIDSFSAQFINSSGTLVSFRDDFADGPPPPCGPAGCSSQAEFYGVNSHTALPTESNNFLQLDSSNGISTTNAGGGARLNETVQVSGIKSKLPQTDSAGAQPAISMTGIFTLPVLSGPLNEGYGIRFIDGTPGVVGDNQWILELNVQWWTGNASNPAGWYVRYLTQDFKTGVITTIDADLVAIPELANEILLSLTRSAGSDLFQATYAYGTGGPSGTFGTLTSLGTAAGFEYMDYVRPQFHAFESVPEPMTLALFGLGLAGIGVVRRRRTVS